MASDQQKVATRPSIVYRIYKKVYRLFYYSAPIQWLFNRKVQHLMRKALTESLQAGDAYQGYVHAQIKKSYDMVSRVPIKLSVAKRTKHLVGLMNRFLPENRAQHLVLCVGCRNVNEVAYIEEVCQVQAEGMDLFSVHPKITTGDMHKMPYADDAFDVLYSCHSLEHAYDLQRAVGEFIRVTKPGGLLVVEVPVNYTLSATDRWDLKSSAGLLEWLGESVSDVLLTDDTDQVARVIVRIKQQGSQGTP